MAVSVPPLAHGPRGIRDGRVALRARETVLEHRERLDELRRLERPIAPANRDLDQDRQHLRVLLLEGAASPPAVTADAGYFGRFRDRVREAGQG